MTLYGRKFPVFVDAQPVEGAIMALRVTFRPSDAAAVDVNGWSSSDIVKMTGFSINEGAVTFMFCGRNPVTGATYAKTINTAVGAAATQPFDTDEDQRLFDTNNLEFRVLDANYSGDYILFNDPDMYMLADISKLTELAPTYGSVPLPVWPFNAIFDTPAEQPSIILSDGVTSIDITKNSLTNSAEDAGYKFVLSSDNLSLDIMNKTVSDTSANKYIRSINGILPENGNINIVVI